MALKKKIFKYLFVKCVLTNKNRFVYKYGNNYYWINPGFPKYNLWIISKETIKTLKSWKLIEKRTK